MNEMQVFQNSEFGELGVLEVNGKPYFPATACAKVLGYSNPWKAINDHCKKDGLTKCEVIDSVGRTQTAKFINEGNLYRLITHSKLPAAERFEKWVFDEVLPTIHRTGSYSQPGAQTFTMEQVTQFAAAVVAQAVLRMSQSTASSRYQEPENHPKEEPTVRRRGQLSSIERLPPNLRREVDEMLCDERCIYADIINRLKEEGISISTASVCRYAQRNRLFPSCGDE